MSDDEDVYVLDPPASVAGGVAGDELRQLIERIERLEEEKAGTADDIKEVYAEAKARGFDTKAMRQMVKLRKKTPQEREEEEAVLDLYKSALGLQSRLDFDVDVDEALRGRLRVSASERERSEG